MPERSTVIQPRMAYPALSVPGTFDALLAFPTDAGQGGLPPVTAELVHLRASPINGRSVCVRMHGPDLRKPGESDGRFRAVARWEDWPFLTDAERAASALTEAANCLRDCAGPVPDEVFDNAAEHGEEPALASLIHITLIHAWSGPDAATRQVAGALQTQRTEETDERPSGHR